MLLRRRPRRAARAGVADDHAHRARHAPADERGGAGPAPRLRGRPARGDLSGHDGRQPRVVGPVDLRRPRHDPGRAARRAVRGPAHDGRARAAQQGGRRARRRPGRRAGAAARGGRHLRRQQVLLPRRRGPGHHRRLALDRRAHHVRRDHRHHRDHPGPGADQRGGRRSSRPRSSPSASSGEAGSLDLHSISFGDTISSWASAAQVCAATHVHYLDAPVRRVISVHPRDVRGHLDRRQGLLQARAGRRRRRRGDPLRPAHHRDLHEPPGDPRDRLPLPRLLREAVGPLPARPLGHARALDPPARRRHLRRRHRRGAAAGRVTLATRIPEEQCRQANLGYVDLDSIDLAAAEADGETFVVPNAGEVLFRLR